MPGFSDMVFIAVILGTACIYMLQKVPLIFGVLKETKLVHVLFKAWNIIKQSRIV